jgi:hypothetical protein
MSVGADAPAAISASMAALSFALVEAILFFRELAAAIREPFEVDIYEKVKAVNTKLPMTPIAAHWPGCMNQAAAKTNT